MHTARFMSDAAGISRLIGPPRLSIMIRPTSKNVAGVIDGIERLRLNHVPQNTPATERVQKHVNELSHWHDSLLRSPLQGRMLSPKFHRQRPARHR
jgi:hypothetical protein